MYRILIIEDDDTIAKNIAAHFNRWNYETKQIADFCSKMELTVQSRQEKE